VWVTHAGSFYPTPLVRWAGFADGEEQPLLLLRRSPTLFSRGWGALAS
jgi:hypothetical protein